MVAGESGSAGYRIDTKVWKSTKGPTFVRPEKIEAYNQLKKTDYTHTHTNNAMNQVLYHSDTGVNGEFLWQVDIVNLCLS